VIVGEDGVVRVLDFGIAAALRAQEDAEAPVGTEASAPVLDAEPTALTERGPGRRDGETDRGQVDGDGATLASDEIEPQGGRLTRVGTLLGTLPYMAPEQLRGQQADTRADQFGFCVAMWEALAGERPFSGRSALDLLQSIAAGPSRAEALPRWLRPILRRGLASGAAERWPSMDALIEAIERVLARRRRLGAGVGLSLALVVASFSSWAAGSSGGVSALGCDEWVASLDFGDERRRTLEAQLESTFDEQGTRYTLAALDQLAEDWRTTARAACADAAAPAVDSRPRLCLDRWRDGFGDTVALLLERGDRRTLAAAPDLLARMQPPAGDYCGQRALAVDPTVERQAERGRSLAVLGDLAAAEQESEAALARAASLDGDEFGAELAVAHLARGEVAAFAGDWDLARRELAAGEVQALGSSAIELLLPTWLLSAKVQALSGTGDQAAFALAFADRAEPLLTSLELGDRDPRRAELLEARGLAERAAGRQVEAIALHRRAQERFVAAGQPTLAAKSLINVGANYQELEDLAAAKRAYVEAIALLDAAGVPPSYRNRLTLERNLGLLAYAETDAAELAAGIPHFEFVRAHGTPAEASEALSLL
ncbi:MAG: protein kinase, partial [Myxococcales bacterium]|nr:protein kinase [Myxococcales bacterium]